MLFREFYSKIHGYVKHSVFIQVNTLSDFKVITRKAHAEFCIMINNKICISIIIQTTHKSILCSQV